MSAAAAARPVFVRPLYDAYRLIGNWDDMPAAAEATLAIEALLLSTSPGTMGDLAAVLLVNTRDGVCGIDPELVDLLKAIAESPD